MTKFQLFLLFFSDRKKIFGDDGKEAEESEKVTEKTVVGRYLDMMDELLSPAMIRYKMITFRSESLR